MRLPLFSYREQDAHWVGAIAQLLSDQWFGPGAKVLTFPRSTIVDPEYHREMTNAIRDAEICYLFAEPGDVSSDPMLLYILGVANAGRRPVAIVSSVPKDDWPQDIIRGLAKIIHIPELKRLPIGTGSPPRVVRKADRPSAEFV